jgi:hypothetical protein
MRRSKETSVTADDPDYTTLPWPHWMLRYVSSDDPEAMSDLEWSVGGSPPYGGVSYDEASAVYDPARGPHVRMQGPHHEEPVRPPRLVELVGDGCEPARPPSRAPQTAAHRGRRTARAPTRPAGVVVHATLDGVTGRTRFGRRAPARAPRAGRRREARIRF